MEFRLLSDRGTSEGEEASKIVCPTKKSFIKVALSASSV